MNQKLQVSYPEMRIDTFTRDHLSACAWIHPKKKKKNKRKKSKKNARVSLINALSALVMCNK